MKDYVKNKMGHKVPLSLFSHLLPGVGLYKGKEYRALFVSRFYLTSRHTRTLGFLKRYIEMVGEDVYVDSDLSWYRNYWKGYDLFDVEEPKVSVEILRFSGDEDVPEIISLYGLKK